MYNEQQAKTPVIILTGFLGAGKTTLLNRLITSKHGARLAVIINEFGEIGIDHHMLVSSKPQVLQLNNGCLCCTVGADLVKALFELTERRNTFDRLIIETSGLAEPAPIAQNLFADERIKRSFSLDRVVTIVDTKHVSQQLHESCEAREQIVFSDLILLNKTDLVDDIELAAIDDKLKKINSVADIYRTRNSNFDFETTLLSSQADLIRQFPGKTSHSHSHHDSHHHHHLEGIDTISLVRRGAVNEKRLSDWFRALIADFGSEMLRMKGVINVDGDDHQFLFQGVRSEFEGKPGLPWLDNDARENRLVFIGRNLDEKQLVDGFENCLLRPGEVNKRPAAIFSNDEISSLKIEQVQDWLRSVFSLNRDVTILIKHVPCAKAGCPPLETALVAFIENEPPLLFKIQQTINNITFDHVYNLIENPMPCC